MKNTKINSENIFTYLECLVKNMFTRFVLFFLILGTTLVTIHPSRFSTGLGIGYIAIGLFIFYLTNFGRNSYRMYTRAYNHLICYEKETSSSGYCGRIGCKVALRRFKKNYPQKYARMMQRRNPPFGMVLITMMLINFQNLDDS